MKHKPALTIILVAIFMGSLFIIPNAYAVNITVDTSCTGNSATEASCVMTLAGKDLVLVESSFWNGGHGATICGNPANYWDLGAYQVYWLYVSGSGACTVALSNGADTYSQIVAFGLLHTIADSVSCTYTLTHPQAPCFEDYAQSVSNPSASTSYAFSQAIVSGTANRMEINMAVASALFPAFCASWGSLGTGQNLIGTSCYSTTPHSNGEVDYDLSAGPDTLSVTASGWASQSGYNADQLVFAVLPNVTFSISNSGNISAAPTGSGSNTITATALVGTPNVTLTISGLPSGATSSFSKYKGATTYTSTLTITTSAVLAGTYPITVTGTNSSEVHTTVFSLIVTAQSVSNSGSINVIAGYSGTTSLSVKAATAVTITLSCLSGLPSGATCSFGPISGTANFTSVLTIGTNPADLGGTYSIVVQANSTYGQYRNAVVLNILGFSLSSVNNLAANQGDVNDVFNNWLTVTSANIGSPSSTVTGTFTGTPAGVTFSAIGPSVIPGTLVYTLYVNASASTVGGTYPITLVVSGANQTQSVSFALIISIPTITTTTIVTQILTNNIGVTSTVATTGTAYTTFTQPFATTTQTLTKYSSYSDIPLVTYGLAILLVLTPTMIVLVVNKTVAGMVIAMSTGIVWAVGSNVLNIDALLLLVGVAAIALLFRVREG